jgi:predicted nucleotide-binding protein
MSKSLFDKVEELIKAGLAVLESGVGYDAWSRRVEQILRNAFTQEAAARFTSFAADDGASQGDIGNQIGYLESLLFLLDDQPENERILTESQNRIDNTKVFVVHGHNNEVKEMVARFIQKISLVPIILHEQPSSGRTIIEKLEAFSDVGFAVVLLTPDDVGGLADNSQNLKKRARQNVILELGYFLGRLSRNRVCALYKSEVEIPSDYGSVLFIELDTGGAWRTKLAQEFVHSGLAINHQGLLET